MRKPNRLATFDHSTPNAYFITVCTKNREQLLWKDVGAAIGRLQAPELSAYGNIVEQAIKRIPEYYPEITVDKFVVMPDHIHLLLQIQSAGSGSSETVAISRVIQQMKGAVTKQAGISFWQKGFYDHVIRCEEDYQETWAYIEANPGRWAERNGGR